MDIKSGIKVTKLKILIKTVLYYCTYVMHLTKGEHINSIYTMQHYLRDGNLNLGFSVKKGSVRPEKNSKHLPRVLICISTFQGAALKLRSFKVQAGGFLWIFFL